MNNIYGNNFGYPYNSYPNPSQSFSMPSSSQMAFVGSIDEAKAYLMQPNQTIYLMDTNSNMLYVKKSDPQCRTFLTSFKLTEIENNKEKAEIDFKAIIDTLNEKIDNLSNKVEIALGTAKNEENKYVESK